MEERTRVVRSIEQQAIAGTVKRNTTIALRALAGESQKALAQQYGISRQAVNVIVNRYLRNLAEARKNGKREVT